MRGRSLSLKILTFALNAFWRSLWVLNAFLLFTAVILSAVFLVLIFIDRIPAPDSVCDMIRSECAERGVVADFKAMSFSLSGGIEADGVRLRFEGTPEPFLTAEKIDVDFWIYRMFSGDFAFRSIRVFNGALGSTFEGAEKSPAFSKIYLDLKKDGGWWTVEALNFRCGRLAAESSGVVGAAFSPREFADNFMQVNLSSSGGDVAYGDAFSDGKSPAETFDRLLEKISLYNTYFEMFSDPVVIFRFHLYGGDDNMFSAYIRANQARFKLSGKEISADKMGLAFRYEGGRESITLQAFADKVSGASLPACDNVAARADLLVSNGSYALENIELAAKKISYDGMLIDNVSFKKDYIDENEFGRNWMFFAALDIYRLGGKLSFDSSYSLTAEFGGTLNPDWVLHRREFDNVEELKSFSFSRGINIDGAVLYSPRNSVFKLKAWVDAQDCVISGIPVENVSGELLYDTPSGMFEGKDIKVSAREGWSLSGSYRQSIDTNRYFIKLRGDIRPMAIASFMAPWWTRVMGAFSFGGEKNFPRADVSVEGTWGSPEFIWCYASTEGADALYGGEKFDAFSMYVWVNPSRITLYDVEIEAADRRAHGIIEWMYGSGGITTYQTQEIFLVSTLNSRELIALGGEDAREVLDVVRFSEAPNMTINAVMQNPASNNGKRDIFNVDAFAPGDTLIECASLKNLRFNARSDKLITQIDNVSCEFCGGQATGSAVLRKTGESMGFNGEAFAEKMNQQKFFEFLASLAPGDQSENSAENIEDKSGPEGGNSIVEGGENGEISVSISLEGDVKEFEKSSGGGYVNLENKDLIKLNLFGALSRAAAALRLPFGSFDITYAHSNFAIKDGVVSFPNLEMGGAVMQIKGAANYDFMKDDIDATLAILPFAGIKTPIISDVVSVINPLTNAIQATVDGQISDPKIGLKVKPANIIQSQEKIQEEIRSDL